MEATMDGDGLPASWGDDVNGAIDAEMRERFKDYAIVPPEERPPAPGPAEDAAWQAGLQAIADAKGVAPEAFAAWQVAEAEFHGCPVWQARARAVRLPEPCDCHWPALVAAYEAYQAAKDEVQPAIDRFKAGEVE
jgi:hypothetical protein